MSHDLCRLSKGEMSDHFPANAIVRYIISLLELLSLVPFGEPGSLDAGCSLTSASQKHAEKMTSADTRLLGELSIVEWGNGDGLHLHLQYYVSAGVRLSE